MRPRIGASGGLHVGTSCTILAEPLTASKYSFYFDRLRVELRQRCLALTFSKPVRNYPLIEIVNCGRKYWTYKHARFDK